MRTLLFILLLPSFCYSQDTTYSIRKTAQFRAANGQLAATAGLTETIVMPTTIELDWRSVDHATNYIVQRSLLSTFAEPTTIYNDMISTCVDTGLTSGIKYYYRVKSRSSGYDDSNWIIDSATTSSSSYDPDAQRFIDSAGISDGTQQAALHTLVYGFKVDTNWNRLIVACPILGGSYNTAKWNLRYPINDDLAYRFVSIGSPTYDAAGMTPSTGNAINTKFIPAAAGLDYTTGMHMSYYSATSASTNSYIMGLYEYSYIAPSPDGFFSYVRVGATHSSGAAQNSSGFHLVNRAPGSGNQRYIRNGTTIINASQAFIQFNTTSNNEVYVGGLNDSPAIYSTVQCGFYTIGKGLTPSQEANLRSRITTFLTAIGR
jgi:hypothetical protein